MHGSDFVFDVGQRVRLRDGIDPGFYDGLAKVGNVGWIVGRRRDPRFQLPEVFIRWDPNHWAYNRQPDKWTYQEHFEPANDEDDYMPDDNQAKREAIQAAAASFADTLSKLLGAGDEPVAGDNIGPVPIDDSPHEVVDPEPTEDPRVAYSQLVEKAHEIMRDAEGFITVVVSRHPHPEAEDGILACSSIGDSLSPEAELVIGMQLSAIGAKFHQNAAALSIEKAVGKGHGK